MVEGDRTRSITSWHQLSTSFLRQFQATKKSAIPLVHLRNIKQKKGESLKSYINHCTEKSSCVTWSPNEGVLAHLRNGVLPETPFWDELQQQERRSVSGFKREANKFLKLENSKEALHKAEGISTKKNDPREVLDDDKSKDKRKG